MACPDAGQTHGKDDADPPRPAVAEVLRAAIEAHPGVLPEHHYKTLNALMACRTAALGGHLYRCEDCGAEHFIAHYIHGARPSAGTIICTV
jgi:Transposase zinc-binding domain